MLKKNDKIVCRIAGSNNKIVKTLADSQNRVIHRDCTAVPDNNAAYSKSVLNNSLNLAKLTTIGGKSVAWNQSIINGDLSMGTYGFATDNPARPITVSNGVATVTAKNPNYYYDSQLTIASGNRPRYANGHLAYIRFEVNFPTDCGVSGYFFGTRGLGINVNANEWTQIQKIITCNGSSFEYICGNVVPDINTEWKYRNIFVCDLTQIYGAGNEPTTTSDPRIAEIEAYASLHPEYNSGEIVSAKVDKVVSEGKNIANPSEKTTTSQNVFFFGNGSTIPYSFHFKKGVTYTFSVDETQDFNLSGMYVSPSLAFRYNTKSVTFTATEDTIGGFSVYKDGTTQEVLNSLRFQIEIGDSATSYTPYRSPIDYPIPSEVQALDGYGWSVGDICNYIDFAEKKFHKKVDRLNLGELTWYDFQPDDNTDPFKYSSTTKRGDGTERSIFTDNHINILQLFSPTGLIRARYTKGTILADTPNPTGMAYFVMNEEVVTDISAYLGENAINVEGGGKLTFKQGESWMWNQLADQFGTPSTIPVRSNTVITQGHKYLFGGNVVESGDLYFYIGKNSGEIYHTNQHNIITSNVTVIADGTSNTNANSVWFYNKSTDIFLIDLTTLYGSGNEPTDVTDPRIAKIEAYARLHPEYNAGQNVYFDRTEFVVPNSEKFFVATT